MHIENGLHMKGTVGVGITEPTDEDLKLINKHTRREFTKDELYVYPVHMCDNEGDRDDQYFKVSDLNKLSNLFKGRTFIQDHSWSSNTQHSRIYKTSVEEIKGRTVEKPTKTNGKPFHRLVGWAYTIKDGNESLINRIDSGILKEVSIGFRIDDLICDICGNSYYDGNKCHHYPGRTYEIDGVDKKAYFHMKDPKEAFEISFVAVPAQQNAEVIKGIDKSKFIGLKQGKKENKKKTKTERSIFYANFEKGGKKSMEKIRGLIKSAKAADSEEINIPIVDLEKELKTYDSVVEEVANLKKEKEELEPKAKMGEQYEEDLKKECMRLGKLTEGDAFNEEIMKSVFEKCGIDELKNFEESYQKKLDEKFPPGPQIDQYGAEEKETDVIDSEDYKA